ncbi:hypothetical protein SLEP1_g53180 [Rubroshorea leprosula]|uniref:Transmembrane protein n=1 Tax=Rubroshorea leprosula TaxID=152421 RepID=A0AAV5M8N6_9ROSI|nr:hypothetical protein SLEP1_g53180 [Rubroshorea leprosula]
MGHIAPRFLCSEVDLEKGDRGSSVEDSSKSPVLGVKKHEISLLSKVYSHYIEGSEGRVSLSSNELNSSGVLAENVKVVMSMNMDGKKSNEEKKVVNEKHQKTSNKKSPKPPRPPRAPSLDAADLKLIRELSELARLKRARIERMKALKNMKAAKPSSSNNNVFAMVFTIIFCLVILFQGMSSRSTHVNMQGSPLPTGATDRSLISMQYIGNPPASDLNEPKSASPNLVVQVPGSNSQKQPRMFAG